MKLLNAKTICDVAAARGFGVPALNNNGGSYDISRAIIEAAQELQSPLIIAEYEPNLEYCGYDWAGTVIRFHAAETTIPICIALDHGKTPPSVLRAVRAGFTHVMIDYAEQPLAENVRGTRQIIALVRPLGISVEAEIGHIVKGRDDAGQRGGTVSAAEAGEFASQTDVDLLAVANGSSHGIFKEQHGMDFELIPRIRQAVKMPLVQHGTCGISLPDITRLVKAGMTKINFGEGMRMNYIRYFNEFSQTLNHEHHAWRIARAAKDRLKEDIKDIIRACGSEGQAHLFK
jgi:ketose-bisphosphate aldolase